MESRSTGVVVSPIGGCDRGTQKTSMESAPRALVTAGTRIVAVKDVRSPGVNWIILDPPVLRASLFFCRTGAGFLRRHGDACWTIYTSTRNLPGHRLKPVFGPFPPNPTLHVGADLVLVGCW